MPAAPTIAVVNNGDGTVTVTVSGSDAGTTNTVRTLKVDSAWPGNAWQAQSPTRVGDGDIVVTLAAGTYFFAVDSDDGNAAWSPPVMAVVTVSAQAVYTQILNAVVTRTRLLALSGIESANVAEHPVLTLKGVWEARKDSVLIGPYEDAISQLPDGGNSTNHFGYPVLIAMVAVANRDEETHANRWFLWGERIRNAFVDLPLTVANGCVYQAEYIPMPVFDKEWWRRNAAASFVALRFKSRETKGM